ncbi:MAG: DinB family protein [Flavobacteriaceae bacterium]|nr:DinB family protein [Flavobacteriaceae bacterium]
MEKHFNILRKSRTFILKLIEGYSIEQLNKIPKEFSNNIVWNVAHLLVTQQLLCYKLSGLPMTVSDEMVNLYRKGTAPIKEVSLAEFEEIKKHFIEFPIQLEKDYANDIFKEYNEYTTSVNVTVTDIDFAISFNNFHEGIHLGSILALRKSV